MRILLLGGDGYLGWPTAMYLSRRGHHIGVVDNFAKRSWELELGIEPLIPISPLHERISVWRDISKANIDMYVGDLGDYRFVETCLRDFGPEAVVHFGEQPSAPYSMIDVHHAAYTQQNNVIGTLNVLFTLRDMLPESHLVKLGTMGEYGTPNIDIEEGFIEIKHNGRSDVLPFPKLPGSFYHLSKVHDSHNIHFACRAWGLRATDLNQGVVYGIDTDETVLDPRLATSFHYDETFGTVLNRFCTQAVLGVPLTLYGKGKQTRGFINIQDTLQCVELALLNPAGAGEFRVFNQFTERFSVLQLAKLVKEVGTKSGLEVEIDHVPNPRVEMEEHYYNIKNTRLIDLGLQPRKLSAVLLDSMLRKIEENRDRISPALIAPRTQWLGHGREVAPTP
jgi:UDP-sulfoquinovose synthase